MANYNKVIIGGNLTADPELRFTTGGKAVCEFSLAINRRRSASSADASDFVRVTAWEDLAQTIAENKKKGDGVIVEGRLRYDSWEATDGSRRSKVTVVANNVQFMPRGSSMRLNAVVLAGNLTRDPEHQLVGDDIARAEFGLAVGRGEDAVDFFNVTAWRGLADAVARNKSKGHPVLIEGRLQYSTWKSAGNPRSRIEVVAENIDYLGSKNGAASGSASQSGSRGASSVRAAATAPAPASVPVVVDDGDEDFDIPF